MRKKKIKPSVNQLDHLDNVAEEKKGVDETHVTLSPSVLSLLLGENYEKDQKTKITEQDIPSLLHIRLLEKDSNGDNVIHQLATQGAGRGLGQLYNLVRKSNNNTISNIFADALVARNSKGYAPIHIAAERGKLGFVERLSQLGVDADIELPQKGTTLLQDASLRGNIAMAELLLRCGANANFRTLDRNTALHFAAYGKKHNISELLLEHGANPNLRDAQGQTALFIACANLDVATVKVILAGGVDCNVQDEERHTALHASLYSAVDEKHKEDATNIVYLLLSCGAKIDIEDQDVSLEFMQKKQKSDFCSTVPGQILQDAQSAQKDSNSHWLKEAYQTICKRNIALQKVNDNNTQKIKRDTSRIKGFEQKVEQSQNSIKASNAFLKLKIQEINHLQKQIIRFSKNANPAIEGQEGEIKALQAELQGKIQAEAEMRKELLAARGELKSIIEALAEGRELDLKEQAELINQLQSTQEKVTSLEGVNAQQLLEIEELKQTVKITAEELGESQKGLAIMQENLQASLGKKNAALEEAQKLNQHLAEKTQEIVVLQQKIGELEKHEAVATELQRLAEEISKPKDDISTKATRVKSKSKNSTTPRKPKTPRGGRRGTVAAVAGKIQQLETDKANLLLQLAEANVTNLSQEKERGNLTEQLAGIQEELTQSQISIKDLGQEKDVLHKSLQESVQSSLEQAGKISNLENDMVDNAEDTEKLLREGRISYLELEGELTALQSQYGQEVIFFLDELKMLQSQSNKQSIIAKEMTESEMQRKDIASNKEQVNAEIIRLLEDKNTALQQEALVSKQEALASLKDKGQTINDAIKFNNTLIEKTKERIERREEEVISGYQECFGKLDKTFEGLQRATDGQQEMDKILSRLRKGAKNNPEIAKAASRSNSRVALMLSPNSADGTAPHMEATSLDDGENLVASPSATPASDFRGLGDGGSFSVAPTPASVTRILPRVRWASQAEKKGGDRKSPLSVAEGILTPRALSSMGRRAPITPRKGADATMEMGGI